MTFQGTTKIEAATPVAIPKNKVKKIDWSDPTIAMRNVRTRGKSGAVKVSVTPEVAAQWLELNTGNRPVTKPQTAAYARDMQGGNWRDHGGDPIQIGSNGVLLNGQHRLHAVIASGATVDMFAIFGADPSAVLAIDRGKSRSHRDTFVLSTGEHVSKLFFPIAMSAIGGISSTTTKTKPTSTEMESFVSMHRKALDFADDLMSDARRGVRKGSVGGVFARAYYHLPHDKIETFADVLVTGVATHSSHKIIVTLRDWLTSPKGLHSVRGKSYSVYRKTARALIAFTTGENIRTLYEITVEPFPFPGKKASRK